MRIEIIKSEEAEGVDAPESVWDHEEDKNWYFQQCSTEKHCIYNNVHRSFLCGSILYADAAAADGRICSR